MFFGLMQYLSCALRVRQIKIEKSFDETLEVSDLSTMCMLRLLNAMLQPCKSLVA